MLLLPFAQQMFLMQKPQNDLSGQAGGCMWAGGGVPSPLCSVGGISMVKKVLVFLGFPGGSDGEESTCNAGDLGLIPGL